ncbi:MAG TPA: nuclear transport factor 2 family protein [Vicinamibacteria bacterium]|nr:nuclear transport factor 2 family protein [Vicinamibacteria bacterium]
MADQRGALREANASFYRAVEELDLAAMDGLWLHESWVRCIHPGWDLLVGWDVVRQSWAQIFSGTQWIRVTPTSIDTQVRGEVGLVGCAENITATDDGNVGVAVAQATNLFLLTPAGWRLFHHHSSPAPVHVTQPFSGTVQ